MIHPDSPAKTFRVIHVILFLLGKRNAIQTVLRCSASLWLGLALVLTATMAREYDAVSWAHQPGDLLGPLGASLMLSGILFLFCRGCMGSAGIKRRSLWRDYRVFLTGYWMTAPLAWFYAFPIETMTDEFASLRFNLTMLSIVSIWRVLLFTRVFAIAFRIPFWVSFSWVLLPCMAVAFVALLSAQLSVVSIMGGVRLTETQQLLFDYQNTVAAGCFYGLLPVSIWVMATIVWLRSRTGADPSSESGQSNEDSKAAGTNDVDLMDVSLSPRVWAWAVVPALVLLVGVGWFQPRLFRSANIDHLLHRGQLAAAIERMETLGADALPVNWDPPPKFPGREYGQPAMDSLIDAIETSRCRPWIAHRLLASADEIVIRQAGGYRASNDLEIARRVFGYRDPGDADQAIASLNRLQAYGHGDAETKIHRQKMIAVIRKARDDALESWRDPEAAIAPTDDD